MAVSAHIPLRAAQDGDRTDASFEPSPAAQIERYLRKMEREVESLPERPAGPLDLREIAPRTFFIVGAVAMYGGFAYRVARLSGWVP